VAYYDQWLDATRKFTYVLPPKYMSGDGRTLHMIFSGLDRYDAFNLIKGTLTLNDVPVTPSEEIPDDDPVVPSEDTPAPGRVVWAVNAGGPDYVSHTGIHYEADTHFTGGHVYTKARPIADTQDDVLYQSERWGDFSYDVPLPNGHYEVTLQFAEIVWRTAHQRLFDVFIEGAEVLSNVDLAAAAGPRVAYDVVVPVHVRDGALTIRFYSNRDKAKISAIVVEAMP
jgi:hypothetical protein